MRLMAGICAAGDAARMGFDKLTRPLSGDPEDCLLARSLFAVQGFDTCVALPAALHPYFAARKATVGPRAKIIAVRDARHGLSESVRALAQIAAQGAYDGVIITLADLPHVTQHHVAHLRQAFEDAAGSVPVQATSESGIPGHPVIFPAHLTQAFTELPPGQGAKSLLLGAGVQYVPFADDAPVFDLDTPEAWETYTGSAPSWS